MQDWIAVSWLDVWSSHLGAAVLSRLFFVIRIKELP